MNRHLQLNQPSSNTVNARIQDPQTESSFGQLPQIEENKVPEANVYQNVGQQLHVNSRLRNQWDDLVLDGLNIADIDQGSGDLNLSPRQSILGPQFNNFFICQICLKVIRDPQECQKCQTAFCAKCLQTWTSQSVENETKCPIRCQQTQFLPIHRFAKQELLQQKFQCPYSTVDTDLHAPSQSYEDALKHLRNCPFRKETCQCGQQISHHELEQHLQVCTKARVYCKNCEISYNFQTEQHDCIQYLSHKCKELKESQELQKFYNNNIGISCPNGHSLYPHRGKTIWQLNFGFIFCDTCKQQDLSGHKVFWRCMKKCDYDLCHQCMYKNIPPQNQLASTSSAGNAVGVEADGSSAGLSPEQNVLRSLVPSFNSQSFN